MVRKNERVSRVQKEGGKCRQMKPPLALRLAVRRQVLCRKMNASVAFRKNSRCKQVKPDGAVFTTQSGR